MATEIPPVPVVNESATGEWSPGPKYREDLVAMVREGIEARIDEAARVRVEERVSDAKTALRDAIQVDTSVLDTEGF